ncbi:MAG: hypothetical protein HUU47_00170 [Bacteroidetes bacterium]|nr:hypothetical protein [Bacteroidota bacterium]
MKHYATSLQFKHFFYSSIIMLFSLAIGVLGYHYFGGLSYTDAFLNASMILTGMGPVDKMISVSAKLFSSFYALYSGVAFLTGAGILLAPAIHVFLKKMKIE